MYNERNFVSSQILEPNKKKKIISRALLKHSDEENIENELNLENNCITTQKCARVSSSKLVYVGDSVGSHRINKPGRLAIKQQ